MQKKKKIMAVNASGVLKLVLTGANSQKKNLRIFLVSLLPCSCKNCRNCVCCHILSLFKYSPTLTDTLPKAQAALLLFPALSEGSRAEASFESFPGVCQHKMCPFLPCCSCRTESLNFCPLLSPVGEGTCIIHH